MSYGGDLAYKLRSEKSANNEITLMKWSPKLDVIALAFADKSVALNRLSWQRVWTHPPSDASITSLSWRPDGKLLGVGYSNGRLSTYFIDDGKLVHTVVLGDHQITCMEWIDHEFNNKKIYENVADKFLSPLPSVDSNEFDSMSLHVLLSAVKLKNHPADPKHLLSLSNSLNVLFVGDKAGDVHVVISGVCHITSFSIGHYELINISISSDCNTLAALVSTGNSLKFKLFDISVLIEKDKELHHIAGNYGQLKAVMEYVADTIQAMKDAWEDSLSPVNRKMEAYAGTLPPSLSIMDEFIILLACGQCRQELRTFLLDDLTTAGIKKIGLSLEISYNSLKRYTINHINAAIQALNFYLHEIHSMMNWEETFGHIGISIPSLENCIQVLNNFSLKAQEFLFVTDNSLQNLKVFFTWLYSTMMRLSDEPLPNVMQEGPTPEELKMIIDFLKNRFKPMSVDEEDQRQTFNLDRVGQYLLAEDLKIVKDETSSSGLWDDIVADSLIAAGDEDVSWLMGKCTDMSLVQSFDHFISTIDVSFNTCKTCLKSSIIETADMTLYDNDRCVSWRIPSVIGSFSMVDNAAFMIYFTSPDDDDDSSLYVCRCTQGQLTSGRLIIAKQDDDDDGLPASNSYIINDVRYYSDEMMSILYSSSSTTSLRHYTIAQLPISILLSSVATSDGPSTSSCLSPPFDVMNDLLQVTSLEQFQGKRICVSGPRKVAAIVSTGGRRIQLYDVDTEQDEDDDNDNDDV
jgi:anaphase-promoting complex subunit 4